MHTVDSRHEGPKLTAWSSLLDGDPLIPNIAISPAVSAPEVTLVVDRSPPVYFHASCSITDAPSLVTKTLVFRAVYEGAGFIQKSPDRTSPF